MYTRELVKTLKGMRENEEDDDQHYYIFKDSPKVHINEGWTGYPNFYMFYIRSDIKFSIRPAIGKIFAMRP